MQYHGKPRFLIDVTAVAELVAHLQGIGASDVCTFKLIEFSFGGRALSLLNPDETLAEIFMVRLEAAAER